MDDQMKQAAERLNEQARSLDQPLLALVAIALDPPQEPETPPGKLVMACGNVLQITSEDGLCWPNGDKSDPAYPIDRIATEADVTQWANEFAYSNFKALQLLARLVASQEPKPELKGEDKEKYVVVEKRVGLHGERHVNIYGEVVFINRTERTAFRVWIAVPKDDPHEKQGTEA